MIVILGIGTYTSKFPNLIGVSRDYGNIIYSLNYRRGYTIVYFNKKNTLKHVNYRIKRNSQIKDKFKLTWSKEEINNFNQTIKETILSIDTNQDSNKHDGLIYFISCHGGTNNVIYDSSCKEVKIDDIIEVFDNENCEYLRGKPKLFIMDFCRGDLQSKPKQNSGYIDNNNNNDSYIKIDSNKTESKNNTKFGTSINTNNISIDNVKDAVENVIHHKSSDVRTIYPNIDGYQTIDGGYKGGYLIRSFTKVINNDQWFHMFVLDQLIMQTKIVFKKLIGPLSGQVIDDSNRMQYFVKFQENLHLIPLSTTLLSIDNDNSINKNTSSLYKNDKFSSVSASIGAKNVSTEIVRHPLVVGIGIRGNNYNEHNTDETSSDDMENFENIILYDCCNIKNSFHNRCGYDIIYQTKTNEIKHLKNWQEYGIEMKDSNNFKTQWIDEEFDDFNEYILDQIIANHNNKSAVNYDALIYVLSASHGNLENIIYDSNGEELVLDFIFDLFDNENCKYLRNKPKIFILNCGRGDKVSKLLTNPLENDTANEPTEPKNSTNNTKQDENVTNNSNNSAIHDTGGESDHVSKQFCNELTYRRDSHCRFIWANAKGYQMVNDETTRSKGSFLIRNITKVWGHKETYDNLNVSKTLNQIIMDSRTQMGKVKINGDQQAQIIDDNNRMPYFVRFKKANHPNMSNV